MSTDPLFDMLNRLCPLLDAVGATYAVTGSVASSLHGQPSASVDVDICLRLSPAQARQLVAAFPKDFYVNPDGLIESARIGGISNVIDGPTAMKADLSFVPKEPYFDEVLARRTLIGNVPGLPPLWVVSPEDIILMKLLWRRDTESQKQWDNALSVVKVQGHRLDRAYMKEWAERLDLSDDLRRLLAEGEQP